MHQLNPVSLPDYCTRIDQLEYGGTYVGMASYTAGNSRVVTYYSTVISEIFNHTNVNIKCFCPSRAITVTDKVVKRGLI